MEREILYINGDLCPHRVISIPGDVSCLFHSLSYCMYGSFQSSNDIRRAVVHYVGENWDDMQVYTCDARGDVYINADMYSAAMLKTITYGSVSELKATAALYPFIFQVYQNGRLQGSFGDDPRNQ